MDIFSLEHSPVPVLAAAPKHGPAPRLCRTRAFTRRGAEGGSGSWHPAGWGQPIRISPRGREANLLGLGSQGCLPSLLPFS